MKFGMSEGMILAAFRRQRPMDPLSHTKVLNLVCV
ncbi:hypothetical protein OK016_03210 [Vibrio chagasii]|nr:hypothetical protein [Vibrio chagasii]